MENPFKHQGAFSWAELVVDDAQKAIEYYTKVIGWKIESVPMPGAEEGRLYHIIKAGDDPVGGIMERTAECQDAQIGWWSYITVDDVDACLAKAEAAGGKAMYPPMDVPNVGRMCAIMDPCGAVVSVIQYVNDMQ
ncbi:VOC family protein [Photobacterium sp. CCB-ST2H9]|uniref:VOC family protein n=1 Tax=unclassified Photobacterium TaxID=2628852 RepID=UPI0020029BE6|nr:VOC family protein [Photobacterium sp. CCB-ST2H9]UTM59928.1 VOC family protein [Photobacterium sp. CCB-ST2H9]